jgi:type I restriction enzyme R subunit
MLGKPSRVPRNPAMAGLPAPTAATLKAMASQFACAATESLENPHILETPAVVRAGGLAALKTLGQPADLLRDTQARRFAA